MKKSQRAKKKKVISKEEEENKVGFIAERYDVLVIGAGHAGIEAALASARMGCKTAVITMNLDAIGNCPCNPSIGGTAKGNLVREIDALGGEIGKTADECFLQSRMLNIGKGPAVHSLRVQIDRSEYSRIMKHKLELQKNLDVKQAEIVEIEKNDNMWSLKTRLNTIYLAKCVVISTGTYLDGRIHVGEVSYSSGPDGMFPSDMLAKSLKKLGVNMRSFKTGTPARVLKSSIDFSVLEEQFGDKKIVPFSYSNQNLDNLLKNKVSCHIAYTNEATKRVILENIHRSPIYSGRIDGIGPRYCPSIEDKMVRFSDKERHQLFIEPCGLNTEEMYLQGMSSSLPEEVQIQFYRTIKGLENVKIMRPAYAIEYSCIDPTQLGVTLEFKDFDGLFGAGQFNGSSGYEEAAAQGFVAGVNAAKKAKGESAFILDRASSYIGTLIDDLVSKGTNEPYRMMTSRSEYRLILRQDNADERLMPIGRELGLVADDVWENFCSHLERKKKEIKRAHNTVISPSKALNDTIVPRGTSALETGVKLAELLKRPQLNYKILAPFDPSRIEKDEGILEKAETEIKYKGYIEKQERQIEEMRRLECQIIPAEIDYSEITGLRLEAIEKLEKIRPRNLGQASRISGVNPADVSVLMIWLAKKRRLEGDIS